MKTIYEFDQCEAAKIDGSRCSSEGKGYLHNPGAPFGFLLCGTHLRSGQKHLDRLGEIPRTWGKYNFRSSFSF